MVFEQWAGLIEMAFVYAIALGFAVWQFISVRRLIRRDKDADTQAEERKGLEKP